MQFKTLTIYGQASNKVLKIIKVTESEEKLILMDFLISHSLPIASSCNGEGVCKRCIINKDLISCQIQVGTFLKKYYSIKIAYL